MKENTHAAAPAEQEKVITASQVNTISLAILALVAVAFTLVFTRFVAIPFVIALLIYTALAPFIRYVTKKTKMPHLLALSLTFLALMALLALIVIFISNSIGSFISGADIYRDKLVSAADWARTAARYNMHIDNNYVADVLKNLQFFNFVRGFGSMVISLTTGFFMVAVFLLFFFAGSNSNIKEDKKPSRLTQEIQSKISFYITVKIIVSLATGLVVWLVLALFKVELAFMFGIITFLLNFIPTIGSIIATVLPVPVIFLQYELGPKFFIIMALVIASQLIIGNIVEPKIMGSVTDLHPVTIIVMLVFWSLIWGVAGAFLAVPLTAVIQVVLSKFHFTKPFAEIMAGRLI
ncbi:MAG: AI-2E family transporter [Elusimicrobium sp.]|jgi:AI-2 transport protein TqsA|nr:AI-2E family transporter [Elusimicrobium sp.]